MKVGICKEEQKIRVICNRYQAELIVNTIEKNYFHQYQFFDGTINTFYQLSDQMEFVIYCETTNSINIQIDLYNANFNVYDWIDGCCFDQCLDANVSKPSHAKWFLCEIEKMIKLMLL